MSIVYISIFLSIALFIFFFVTSLIRWVHCGEKIARLLPALSALGYDDLTKECHEHIKKYRLETIGRGDPDRTKAENKLAKKICKIEIVENNERFKILRKYQLIIKFYKLGTYSVFLAVTVFILGTILLVMGY